jgi:hypothetical protein
MNHMLAIGIDQYLHQPMLHNCVKDVTDIIGILTLNYALSSDRVKALPDSDATRENIIVELDALSRIVGENDNLVVLFSGHGHLRKDIAFWIPVDARGFHYLPASTIRDYLLERDPSGRSVRAVSDEVLRAIIRRIYEENHRVYSPRKV